MLGWRDVPTGDGLVGPTARRSMPRFRQLFLSATLASASSPPTWCSTGWPSCVRKRAERESGVYFPSLSGRTIVYKGMLTTGQLEPFFPDLSDQRVESRARAGPLALLHQHLPVLAAGPPVPVRRPQR